MSTIWTPECRALALACCKKWHGVNHRNRACVPGVAIDCIHLIREILIESEIIARFPLRYYNAQLGAFDKTDHVQRQMLATLFAFEVSPDAPEFGDIAVFKTGKFSGHAAFYTIDDGGQLWHSLDKVGVTVSDYALYKMQIETLIRISAPGIRSLP
jgi:hypothetical protein